MITDSLLVTWRDLLSIRTFDSRATRQRLTGGRRWQDEAFSLRRELRIRGALVIDCAVCGSTAHMLRSGLRVHVIVCHVALLGVLVLEGEVSWIGRGGDDVPGVKQAGEEAEAC